MTEPLDSAPWRWNTTQTAAAVASGAVSAREVVESHLGRLDEVNPALNAVTFDTRESALASARDLDERFAASGPVGALHGVPVTIKENIDVAGQPTTNGLPVLADLVATDDSPLVAHLRNAGAVIVGRTNTPELSYRWHTDNPLRGETHNPWSPNRTPGGSSGGAAASVAAGIGTIAHGNDLGGSIRQPANCCGLVGLRPSLGRVPAYNPSAAIERSLALQLMSVQGPLGREVSDIEIAFSTMAAFDARDPWYRPGATTHLGAPPSRVAVTYGAPDAVTAPEVVAAVDHAASILEAAGYDIEMVEPPSLRDIATDWRAVLAAETSVTLADQIGAIGSADLVNVIDWMLTDAGTLDLAGYVDALTRRNTVMRDWSVFLENYPLVIAPVSQQLPFTPGADAASRESFGEIYAGHAALVAVNYLGLPAVAVPTVLTTDGPVGVQLIGRWFDEDRCLAAARAVEQDVGVMTRHLLERSP